MKTANRGWRSSKLHLSLITMSIIVGSWLLMGAPSSVYAEMCMALVAAAGLYAAPATLEKFIREPNPPSSPPPPVA